MNADRDQLTISVLQDAGHGQDKAANLHVLERAARDASAAGATLLLTPEMFLTGYAIGPAAIGQLAEPCDGPSLQIVGKIARQAGVGVVIGYPERGADGRIFNAAAYVAPTGKVVANYRKSHLFGALDRDAFSAGDGEPVLFDAGPMKAGLLICYDIEFPEAARHLALRGADLLVVPTALMQPYGFIPKALVATRAYENQVFLAYANRCGQEADLTYCGESTIIGPDGLELARADAGPALITATLDRDLLARSRSLNTYLADRRPDLYAPLSMRQPGSPRQEPST